jgi:integrase/recombinase XerD
MKLNKKIRKQAMHENEAHQKDQSQFTQLIEKWLSGKRSPLTQKAYRQDAQLFTNWLGLEGVRLEKLGKTEVEQYRTWLSNRYKPNAAARKFVVARQLLELAYEHGFCASNLARKVAGLRLNEETPHNALSVAQARLLLGITKYGGGQGSEGVEFTSELNQPKPKSRREWRDYAIVMLLLRTGIRRSECSGLLLGDLQMEQGHHIAVLEQTKGGGRRKIKIPVDVWRVLEAYLAALGYRVEELASQVLADETLARRPLFVAFRKGDRPQATGISGQVVPQVVESACQKAGLELKLTPHGLRATFVTLALESGANLEQVQYAVGHRDPRTTERYQTRKLNLDQNAVDFIRL